MPLPGAATPAGTARPGGLVDRGFLPPYGVFACSVVFFWVISLRSLVYTVMPTVAADLNLSSSAAGMVIASMLLGYGVASWFAGWLPGSRKARVMGGIVLSIPSAVMLATAPNVGVLLLASVLTGLGIGVYLPLGLSLIIELGGTSRRARYVAFHEVAATFASFIGSAVVAVALTLTDWHGSILAWCLIGVAALVVFALIKDETGSLARRASGQRVPFNRPLVLATVIYAVGATLVSGVISVLPLIMVRGWGLDQGYAASVTGYTRLAGLVGVAIAGLFADRLGHFRIVFFLQLFAVVGAAAMALGGDGPLFVLGTAVMAIGASGNIVLTQVVMTSAFPLAQRQQALATATGIGGLTGLVLSPALFGALVDAGLPSAPMLVVVASTIVMILATRQLSGLRAEK